MNDQPSKLVRISNGFINNGMLFMCLSIPLTVVALAVGLLGFGWNCMVLAVMAACVGFISYVIGRGCLAAKSSKSVTVQDEKRQNRN